MKHGQPCASDRAVRSRAERRKMPPRLVRQIVMVDGRPIAYECVGEGETIVFVHGLSGSTLWWRRNIPELALHYRLYLVDLPGFGAMRRHRQHFRLEKAAEWLYAWTEGIGL